MASIYLYRYTLSGQSRVHRVMQLRTDDVHCRESAGTGSVVLKVVSVMGAAFSSFTIGRLMAASLFPYSLLVCSGYSMCDIESIGGGTVLMYVCSMYVCMYGQPYQQSMDQPGKVANPARSQLKRENEYFLVPFAPETLALRDGFSCPVPHQPPHSPYSGWIWCLLTRFFPISAAASIYLFKQTYTIGSVLSLLGHAIAYRWRSLPRQKGKTSSIASRWT